MIAQRFYENVAKHPKRPALCVHDIWISYQRLQDYVLATKRELTEANVQPGQRPAIPIGNNLISVALLLAAADLGIALVPLRTGVAPYETQRRACEATRAHHHHIFPIKPILSGHPLHPDYEEKAYREERPYLITTTSGSTGNPKPVVITQGQKMKRIEALVNFYQLSEEDTILVSTPMHHSLAQRLVLLPLMIGGSAIIMDYRHAPWVKALQESTFTIAVPSQIMHLTAEDTKKMPRLRNLVSSSARLSSDIIDRMHDAVFDRFSECYGTTEIAVATINRFPCPSNRSVGHELPGVDVAIIDEENNKLPHYKQGEIVVKSPYMMEGYFDDPHPKDSLWNGTHFRTGDLGMTDLANRLHLTGRKSDRIKVGGTTVVLQDVTDLAHIHPSILEAAAFAIPDSDLGEVVGLAMVPRDNPSASALRAFFADHLTPEQAPRHLMFVDKIPVTQTGKVLQPALLAEWKERYL